jgi:hypothetical protein
MYVFKSIFIYRSSRIRENYNIINGSGANPRLPLLQKKIHLQNLSSLQ